MQELPPRSPGATSESPTAAEAPAAEAPTAEVAITGVAKGALGTGTALEDTQEWVVPEEPRLPRRDDAAPVAAEPVAGADPIRPPARRRPVATPRTSFAATPRAAGIAAAALLALIGVAAVVTSRVPTASNAGDVPAVIATAAPTAAAPADQGGGNGIGNGDDKDKGGSNGRGNGNGNGNH